LNNQEFVAEPVTVKKTYKDQLNTDMTLKIHLIASGFQWFCGDLSHLTGSQERLSAHWVTTEPTEEPLILK